MARRKSSEVLAELRSRGFNLSRRVGPGRWRIDCGACSVVIINGVACHETGCPNTPVACRECGNTYTDRELAAQCCQPDGL
jgi:hypothetical protein